MKITDIPPERNVKIGLSGGSGFIYCGKMGDCDLQWLDDEMFLSGQSALSEYQLYIDRIRFAKTRDVSRQMLDNLQDRKDYIENYVHLLDREIMETYPSCSEDALIVLYFGYQSSAHHTKWMIDETPRKIEISDTNGAIELLAEIYRGHYEHLASLYAEMYMALTLGQKETTQKCLAKILKLEKMLGSRYITRKAIEEASRKCAKKSKETKDQIAKTMRGAVKVYAERMFGGPKKMGDEPHVMR